MKELSIEQKAQRYNEARERAKQFQNHWIDRSGDELIQEIFPELKENEDERVRKALIDYFNDFTLPTFEGLEPKKILAWLEKQSEAWSEEDEYYYGIIQYILNNERVGKADKENASNWFKSIKDRVQPQPNPKWSEEDDYNLQCMIAKVTSDIQKGNVGRNNELIDWLKSLKDRVQPQPKQEWSEWDEDKFRDVIRIIEQGEPVQSMRDHYIDWIKSLKPQNK